MKTWRMLDNWSIATEEEIMENRRRGIPNETPAIQAFAEALVDAERQYLYKNPMDTGTKTETDTTVYMSKEDKENLWLSQ